MENMNITNPIYFWDYDKISDVLMHLGPYMTFRFNVRLATKDKEGQRKFMHTETRYDIDKYEDVDSAINIKREMDFYYSIENSLSLDYGISFRIYDVHLLREFIRKNIIPWVTQGNVFKIKCDNSGFFLTDEWTPQTIRFSQKKYLEFEPVIYRDNYGIEDIGIRMIVNDPDNYVDLHYSRFYTFYLLLTPTEMYPLACSLINYAKIAPYGLYMNDISD